MPPPRVDDKLARSHGHSLGLVLALSGPVCGGKTTLARGLTTDQAEILSTRDLLVGLAGGGNRRILQQIGEELDRREAGAWVCRPALRAREELDRGRLLIIDAVRTADQVAALRESMDVVHVHLTANADVLEDRYEQRRLSQPELELAYYDSLRRSATETAADELADLAELVLRTDVFSIAGTLAEARSFLAGSKSCG